MTIWPSTKSQWIHVYKARKLIATAHPTTHGFLFHLDWNTEPNLIEAATEVGDNPVLNDPEWRSVSHDLNMRLRRRWFGRAGGPARLPNALVGKLSKVVKDAVDLTGNLAVARDAILSFTLGDLREGVAFPADGAAPAGKIVISDPDSYFIWFFSEFGMLAMDLGIDASMWAELLPATLHGGLYYSHRFPRKRSLTSYSLPPLQLEPAKRAVVDQLFVQLSSAAAGDHGKLLRLCMKEVATSFQ